MNPGRQIESHVEFAVWFRRLLIVVVLPLCFRTFQFFPGLSYVQEAWFVVCLLCLISVYPYLKIRDGLRVSHLEISVLVTIVATVAIATRQAHAVFGQPVIFGLLSQRDVVSFAFWLVLLHILRSREIGVADFEFGLLALAWFTCALFVVMRIFLSPVDFLGYGEGLVTHPMVGVSSAFKLQEFFILFGVFYYALIGIRTRRSRYYVIAALLFPVTLGASGRGMLVAVLFTLFFFLILIRGFWQAIFATAKFLALASVLFLIAYAISPATVLTRVKGFSDAFSVAFTGAATQDPSANARIIETVTALPYIFAHPILGNGIVSHQWQGGSETAMGAYFFASDIGILGILFSYGLVGSLLYAWQYWFAWKITRQLPKSPKSPLLDAIKAFLLYSAIYSLQSGMFVWNANVTLFFVVLLFGISAQQSISGAEIRLTGGTCNPARHALSA